MQFSMMAVDGDRLFDACKRFLIMDMESIVKMDGAGCSDEYIKEAWGICCNHATNLYVCGLIDEEFYRFSLGVIIENEVLEGLVAVANEIRKDIVKCTG